MKQSKVISTIAISLFAFTMINCSAKHDTRNSRDLAPNNTQAKAKVDCKINTNNPVGEFYMQVENLKDLRNNNVTGGKIEEFVVVQLNKVNITDQENQMVVNNLENDVEFYSDRFQAQFIKDFLPNGLIQVYSLEDTIASLPEKNCAARSIYSGDLLTLNNQSYRVYDANEKAIRAEGAKVLETFSYMRDAKAVAVNNVTETNLNISTESNSILGTNLLENFDNRNNILLIREGSVIRTKTADVRVVIMKHFFIVPKSQIDDIKVSLSSQEATLLKKPIVAEYEKQKDEEKKQKQKEEENTNLDEKTWSEIKADPIDFITAHLPEGAVGVWESITGGFDAFEANLTDQLNKKMSLSKLLDLDKALDAISKKKIKSVEALNMEKNQPQTPAEEAKVEDKKAEEKKSEDSKKSTEESTTETA